MGLYSQLRSGWEFSGDSGLFLALREKKLNCTDKYDVVEIKVKSETDHQQNT